MPPSVDSERLVVDCDVHPYLGSVRDVFPYLDEGWRRRFSAEEFQLSGRAQERYMHPGHTLRQDALPPEGGSPGSDPEFMREHLLDEWQVGAALLLPLQPCAVSAWTDPPAASAFTAAANEHFIERWCAIDPRYWLAMVVSPHDPDEAARAIRRIGTDPHVVGVQLPLLNILMGNRYYYPIYEAAAELELAIVVHPTGSEGSYLGTPVFAGGIPRTYAERHALLAQIAQSNLVSLLFEGVFERYPGLKVAFVELGFSWLATLLWRLDREWKNFRSDTPWVRRTPAEYVFDHIRLTTQPLDEPPQREELTRVLEMMGAEHTLCFASDYPHYDNDEPRRVFVSLPDRLRDRIGHQTALETFGRMSLDADA